LSSWSELIEKFKLLPKGSSITKLKNLRLKQDKSCGGLIILYEIFKRLGVLVPLSRLSKGRLPSIDNRKHTHAGFKITSGFLVKG